jgi:hypothetical protein
VLDGVYHPHRLRVIDPCRHVRGTVVSTHSEEDGDLHFNIRLDSGATGMLMPNNYSEQHAALVVELMPRDHVYLPAPQVGDHVSLTGAYVDDTEHDWSELHPVWAMSINGGPVFRSGPQYGGSPPSARSDDAVGSCQTNTGSHCVPYSGASPSTPSAGGRSPTSSSTSSAPTPAPSSSTGSLPIVHPGAFCSPEGAKGVTSRGTPMTCKTTSTDSRARWRSSG